jgi:hypothetical protein
MWPKQDFKSMNNFTATRTRTPTAYEVHLVRVVPPYKMALAWAPKYPVSAIRVHRKVADSLLTVLTAIKDHYGTQEAIEAARMHLYGGGYMFRLKRGGHDLSIHSWGAAIDLDPEGNPFGGKVTMPQVVVDAFAKEGWVWGGPWHTHDGMHFQAATL